MQTPDGKYLYQPPYITMPPSNKVNYGYEGLALGTPQYCSHLLNLEFWKEMRVNSSTLNSRNC